MSTEPFFDEFHRLRPDVAVVLLPPEPRTSNESAGHDLDVEEPLEVARSRADAARRLVTERLTALWPLLGAGQAEPADLRLGWVSDGEPGSLRARASARLPAPSVSVAELEAVHEQLLAQGWQSAVRTNADGSRRLVADRDRLYVEVVAWAPAGPWDVSVAAAVPVGRHASELRVTGSAALTWGETAPDVTL